MLKEQHLPPLALILCFTVVHHKQRHIAKPLDLLSSICTSSESSMPRGIGHRLRLWRGRASRAVRIGMEAVNGAPGGGVRRWAAHYGDGSDRGAYYMSYLMRSGHFFGC